MNSNTIQIQENIIRLKGTQKEEPVFTIKFNDSEFTYYHTKNLHTNKTEINKPFELLPSIYCTIKKRWDDDLLIRYYNKYENTSKFISKIYIIILMIINKYRYNNQNIEVILEVRNKRDRIEITEGLYENTNLLYINKNKSLSDKMNIDMYESSYEELKPINMYVDTERIFYPETMGGGANRCVVWNIFQTLNLMNTFKEDYKVFDVETMLEASSHNEEILELCSNYENCGYLLKKFRNGTYNISETMYDSIELMEYKGYYFPIEGKHRVCIAKRFKIPKVYAEVTSCIDIKKKQKNEYSYDLNSYMNRLSEEDITSAYYYVFKNIGLNEDDIRFITEQGLSDAEVIEYIEKTTKKSLVELAKEVSKDESKCRTDMIFYTSICDVVENK